MAAPSPAELARTTVARARVGTMTSHPAGGGPRDTVVAVSDDGGALVVSLAAGGPAAAGLADAPRVTVRVAPEGCQPVCARGPAEWLDEGPAGLARYRVRPDDVRLGHGGRPVGAGDYDAAAPDPLRDQAPSIIERLRRGDGAALAACVRAHGHRGVRWVEPVALDRYGLELVAARDDGVEVVRLSFPAPLTGVDDLGPDLAAVMLHGGGCDGCPAG